MMTRIVQVATTLVVAALALASLSRADVPHMINYQGILTDSNDSLLDTTVAMGFVIYDDSIGGSVKWMEPHPSVTVERGVFSVILGATVPIDDSVFNRPNRWLGITVGMDPELTPRTRLVSVAYSHRVSTVDGASGGTVLDSLAIQGGPSFARVATLEFDPDGEGGLLSVARSGSADGFIVDGNYNGTLEPRVTIDGSATDAVFDLSLSGDACVSLPSDAISTTEILDEPGIARNVFTTGVPLVSGEMQDIVTVAITIPATGYIYLSGRCYVRFDNTRSYRSAFIQIDEEAGGSTESGAYIQLYLDTTVSNDYYRFPAYVDRVYQKEADTYTFRLEGVNTSAAGGAADVYGATITAVYYPTSYGSVTELVQEPGDHPDAVTVSIAGDEESEQTTYKVDLRYYELRAKEARLQAMQAERDLLEAQMPQRTVAEQK